MRTILPAALGLLLWVLPTAATAAQFPSNVPAVHENVPTIDSESAGGALPNVERTVYLPMVNYLPTEWPSLPSDPDQSRDFIVDRNKTVTRLIQLRENGGKIDRMIECGHPGKVEVFVFGSRGEPERLSDIGVQVTHIDAQGKQHQEIRWTRVDGDKRGTVQFRLDEFAEVSIVEDAAGEPLTSETIRLTGKPIHVSNQWLADAGYCNDTESCWTVRHENTCHGRLSWNVVFKQR